jgi:polyisoprenoid-binding protein YceI
MRNIRARSISVGALAIAAVALFLSAAAAPPHIQDAAVSTTETLLAMDPAESKVHWTLDTTLHTVHGTFNLKSGVLRFDSQTGKAAGDIVIFATSGATGNDSRDARMHKEILETAKYPDIVFHPSQIEGKVAASGPSDVQLHGVISIHGNDHQLVAPVHAELNGQHWKGTTKFEVPYVSWGIKDPSNFLLKVKKVVTVELEFSGSAKSAQ